MSRLYVARNPRAAARSLGGEMMIMSGRDSTLFTLNRTATILWESADGNTPLDEIVSRRICAEFEVEPGVALQDAETLARELASHEIMQVSEEPIGISIKTPVGRPAGQPVGQPIPPGSPQDGDTR